MPRPKNRKYTKIPLWGIANSSGIVSKSRLTIVSEKSRIILIHYAPIRMERIGRIKFFRRKSH